jgi:hypothetical protein
MVLKIKEDKILKAMFADDMRCISRLCETRLEPVWFDTLLCKLGELWQVGRQKVMWWVTATN